MSCIRGQTLFRQLRSQPFDLFALDLHAPGRQGEEVLRWVRQNLAERLPVLFMTNASDTSYHDTEFDDCHFHLWSAAASLARVGMPLRGQNPRRP